MIPVCCGGHGRCRGCCSLRRLSSEAKCSWAGRQRGRVFYSSVVRLDSLCQNIVITGVRWLGFMALPAPFVMCSSRGRSTLVISSEPGRGWHRRSLRRQHELLLLGCLRFCAAAVVPCRAGRCLVLTGRFGRRAVLCGAGPAPVGTGLCA